MARAGSGGRRQGTPGKSYANRTDLQTNYGQSQPGASAASGGQVAPAPAQPQGTGLTPDQVPKLDDPTSMPNVPLTHGLNTGPGAGQEAIGVTPGNPIFGDVRAAYLRNPTPELRRVLALIATQGWDR